jgi:predicted nucleotidyltransferase
MIHKCSYLNILEIFFKEPTTIHFIREIGRKINLAQTSVRNHIKDQKINNLVISKKSKPFNGYIANRENEDFVFYKQAYNFYSLLELKKLIVNTLQPKAVIIFGSYSRGEDLEESDIDILIITKVKKEVETKKLEKKMSRKINLIYKESLENLEEPIKSKVLNGWVIHGEI